MTELVLQRTRTLERGWIVGWFVASRAFVFVTAALVDVFGPRGYTGGDERAHPLGLLASWDGRWYRTVAANGYLLEPGRQSDPAFFPLFPLLLRVGHALGMSYAIAGIVIANAAFLLALFLFEALTRDMFDAEVARRATALLAVFPLSYVFSLAYPESLVLALIAGAVLAARRGRWGLTAAALAAGALARPETVFVVLPLVPLARRARSGAAYGALLAPLAAIGAFALYLGHTLGHPLAWTQAERAWGRKFELLGFVRAVELVPQQFHGNGGIARDVACFVGYVLLLAIGRRRGVPRLWLAAAAFVVVLPTFSGSFHSIGRFGLLAPALVWSAALAIRSRASLAYVVSTGLMVAGVATLPYFFP